MRLGAALIWVAALGGVAHADAVRVPPGSGVVPHVLYIDRCPMDCTITAGAVDDARTDTSSLIAADAILTRMPRLDLVWADIVLCLGRVFGPYDLEIATEEPAADTDYLEIKVAGEAIELGLDDVASTGPIATDCSPLDHALGFAYTNTYDLIEEPTTGAAQICAAIAHQAGHMLGLEDSDDCRDLMRGIGFCAEPGWFHDLETSCLGCSCRARQRAHDELFEVLGAGAGEPPPSVEIRSPLDGGSVEGELALEVLIVEGRPLERIELIVNDRFQASPTPAGSGRYVLRYDDDGVPYAQVEVLAVDDLGRIGGDTIAVQITDGCAVAGAPASWPLLLALALLLRSSARAAASRRAPRRSRPRAPAPPRAG